MNRETINMKKAPIILMLAAIVWMMLSCAGYAQTYPEHQGYVTDTTGTLNAASEQYLETTLKALKEKTTAEVAVAVVDTLGGVSVEEYAVKLFEKWKPGRKGKDNGVLFVVAVSDHKMRIEVGYGLEGVINDARTGRIMDENVIPAFKSGDMNAGIVAGAEAIAGDICKKNGITMESLGGTRPAQTSPVKNSAKRGDEVSPGYIFTLFAVVIGFVIFFIIFALKSKTGTGSSSGSSVFNDSDYSSNNSSDDSFGGGESGGGGASRDW